MTPSSPRSNSTGYHFSSRVLRFAASAALLLCITLSFQSCSTAEQTVIESADATQEIKLPDGSVVTLNVNSSLSYPGSFGTSRSVTLKGEAFFDIAPNAGKPLEVLSGPARATVSGTSFNLNAFNDDVVLSVISGEVLFEARTTEQKVRLKAGQRAICNGPEVLTGMENSANETSWLTGKLVFEDDEIRDVVIALSNHFRKRVVTDDGRINSCKVTASFSGASLETIMKKLAKQVDAKLIDVDGGYMLSNRGC